MALDLGIDFDRLTSELGNDLGDVFGRVAAQARGGLERVADIAQNTGTGLERIAQAGGGVNPLARIAALGGGGGTGLGNIANYGSYGGAGTGLDFVDQLGGSSPFAAFERASANLAAQPTLPEPQTPAGSPGATGAGGGTGGSYDTDRDKFEQYRPWIEQYARANNIDPDAFAAMLWIETDGGAGGATAVSGAGAQGLGQIMPGTWNGLADPGDNPFNAEHSIKNAAKYFADQYRRFGSYDLAAAAYQGGPGAIVNGRARSDVSDGNLTPAEYAAQWKANYDRIRSSAPTRATGPGYAGSAQGVASLYGGTIPPITQEFGRTDFSTGAGESIYNFGSEMGLDGDSHTGWDVGSAVGTNFYMPAGLGGTVTIAGCTPAGCFYTDEQRGAGEGRGELRIKLDNGYELILGHNSAINVKAGQRVTAGMLLGQTGYANGAHQHVEVRVPDPSTPSKWRIVDPSVLFGNAR